MMQALDARTPATGMHPGGLSRMAAALAGTMQRSGGGGPRLSFAASGADTLLDLEAFDANGERSPTAGPTPLLRQQLLGDTPLAVSAVSMPRAGVRAAATPAEVLALREEVAVLQKQLAESAAEREEMAGLLGGYQRSIQELQARRAGRNACPATHPLLACPACPARLTRLSPLCAPTCVQDQHSAQIVRLRGEHAALKAEVRAAAAAAAPCSPASSLQAMPAVPRALAPAPHCCQPSSPACRPTRCAARTPTPTPSFARSTPTSTSRSRPRRRRCAARAAACGASWRRCRSGCSRRSSRWVGDEEGWR